MDKQIKYLLGVLIVLIISAYFLSLLSGLPSFITDDIIAFLEEETEGEITLDKVSLWPLNRINVKNFEFIDKSGNTYRADELNLDYSLNLLQDKEIIEIDFVELKNSMIEINNLNPAEDGSTAEAGSYSEAVFLNQRLNLGTGPSESGDGNNTSSPTDFLNELKLPGFLANLKLNIRDSVVKVDIPDYHFTVNNLQLGLRAVNADQFELSFASQLEVRELLFSENNIISDFSLEEVEIKFEKNGRRSEIYFNTAPFAVEKFRRYLPEGDYSFRSLSLNQESLTASAEAKGELLFAGSELRSYKTEIQLDNLEASAQHDFSLSQIEAGNQTSGAKDSFSRTIDFKVPEASILISGPDLGIVLQKTNFRIDENEVEAGFKYAENGGLELYLAADEFLYDYAFLSPYLEKGSFDFQVTANREPGSDLKAALELKVAEAEALNVEFSKADFELRLEEGELFLDRGQLNFAEGSQLELKGNYNLRRENYMLRAQGQNLRIAESAENILDSLEIQNKEVYLNYLDKIKTDQANFSIDTAGIYGSNNQLSATGDFSFDFQAGEEESRFDINSTFWFFENNLTLSSFRANSDYGRLDLTGDINFADREFKLRYAGRNFDADAVNNFLQNDITQLNELNAEVEYLEGSINDDFTNPTVSLNANIPYLSYGDFHISDLSLKGNINNKNLEIENFEADLNKGLLKASGSIDNITDFEQSSIQVGFSTERVYFTDIAEAFSREIPLDGELSTELNLGGSLANPDLSLDLIADNTVLMLDGAEYEFSSLNASVERENGSFILNKFTAVQQNLELNAGGSFSIESGFDLNLEIDGFETEKYLAEFIPEAYQPGGTINLNGNLSGDINSPLFQFELISDSLTMGELDLSFGSNTISYRPLEDSLIIEEFNFNIDQGSFLLTGQLDSLRDELITDLELSLDKVPIENTFSKFYPLYPFADDLLVSGPVDITGRRGEINAELDLSAEMELYPEVQFSLSGKAGRELDLSFSASELPISVSTAQYDFNLNLSSRLDLDGTLQGDIFSPKLNLDHQFSNISLNETELRSLEGNIVVDDRNSLSADEQIEFQQGGTLSIQADYAINSQEIELISDLSELPLGFVLSFFPGNLRADGELNGNAVINGSISDPLLDGEINLVGQSMELGLSDPIENYNGTFELNNDGVVVRELNADFADGNFSIGGSINPFAEENAWNLTLQGEELYFLHGSLDGEFDADLAFKGPLNSPLLSGDLEAYNFVISIPWKWPTGDSGDNEQSSDNGNNFVPRLDLDIAAGSNVSVESSNMDILISEGDLNLKFNNNLNDPLIMEGSFTSTRGTFTYYNSRFSLINGQAVFTPVDENDIPTISANARTYAGGREINISVNGPANNMRTTLSSNPEATEEEILNLLSTQGALGSALIGGEDIGIQTIITQELIRILNAFLQEDVINPIESDFQSALALDRIEIDAYQYGLEREFALYLGKNITNNFYVEYASNFSEGEQSSNISFQYSLTDLTVLKGTYFGEGDYRFSIETGFDF